MQRSESQAEYNNLAKLGKQRSEVGEVKGTGYYGVECWRGDSFSKEDSINLHGVPLTLKQAANE